jgi:hypothetical protein
MYDIPRRRISINVKHYKVKESDTSSFETGGRGEQLMHAVVLLFSDGEGYMVDGRKIIRAKKALSKKLSPKEMQFPTFHFWPGLSKEVTLPQ